MPVQAALTQLTLVGLPGIPNIQPGDDLARLITGSLAQADLVLEAGDILVITSKLVSKAEGRFVDLRTVVPSARAVEVAQLTRKDPRLVELILQESSAISRMRGEVLIVRHRLGFTLANAGIDHSNVGRDGEEWVLLLPEDPDESAQHIRQAIHDLTGTAPGIVISDSFGRPFRVGTVGTAVGLAGLPAAWDMRGMTDLYGRVLQVTVTGLGDEIAAAAGLILGQAAEGIPVALVRGLKLPVGDGHAAELVRPAEQDLYADHLQPVR
ncbi:MAG: coenzyme F420-0:L-glutamate ligase [Chloroflexi bacterium]|nr:coenzyme F420-0:L-glutamate ligase [Chloroflexota bacterium]